MKKISPVRGKIPPYTLFFLLYISRIVVTFTYIRSVSVGKMNAHLLLSLGLGMILTLVLSLPAYLCVKRGVSIQSNRIIALLYAAYFVYFCGVSIYRFSYFACAKMNVNMTIAFFVIMITAAVAYCSTLGLEAMSRFGFFCGIIVMLVIISVLLMNAESFRIINFYPMSDNDSKTVLLNAVIFCANSNEPVLLLLLGKRTNGNVAKPYFFSIAASFASIILLIGGVLGVMGNAATMQSYPIFTLFQLASIGSFSRLDIVHVSFWILSLLVKASLLMLAASDCVKAKSNSRKCVCLSVASGAVALVIAWLSGIYMVNVTKIITASAFAVFVLILPAVYLLLNRRKSYEK